VPCSYVVFDMIASHITLMYTFEHKVLPVVPCRYVGFDMIANGAEEARNPRRDIPLATALCLGMCTLLYAAASTVIAGELPLSISLHPTTIIYLTWKNNMASSQHCDVICRSASILLLASCCTCTNSPLTYNSLLLILCILLSRRPAALHGY
jgi:amino acid transporter